MTYNVRETSLQDGEPIELYQFNFGSTVYYFTSASTGVSHLGQTWQPALLKRDAVSYSAEKGRNNLKIKTTREFVIADLYRVMPPSEVILLTLYRLHVGESDAVIAWSGRVLNVDFSGSVADLNCEPVTTSLKQTGLRRLYQRQCPHVLYGDVCKVSKASFTVPVTLSSVNGTVLNSATFGLYASNHFAGGYIDFVDAGVTERRFITEHTGSQITINLPLQNLAGGSDIMAYAGCDHTTATCKNKFNNLNNYGGMPHIPQKNPFGGNGIY